MRETIYILGLEVPSKLGERPAPVGEDVDVAINEAEVEARVSTVRSDILE